MDYDCKHCCDTGEVTVETGNRSIRAPFTPTMTVRYCDCAKGQENVGAYLGPHYPDAEKADRAVEAHKAEMIAQGLHLCKWCDRWLPEGVELCGECEARKYD